ncbi:hypothetical protein CRUP_027875, partial [Coryphaenoides rupestris]
MAAAAGKYRHGSSSRCSAVSPCLQTPIISIEPHSASVRAGSSASFKCRVYSGAQPVRLEWKMANNRPLPANAKISRDGSVITISNAQPSSRGSYHCVASNLFGITQSIVSLNVRESPVGTVTPSGPVRVRVGDPIVLECQSSGEPRPVVSWRRLGIGRKTLLSSPVPMESNAVLEVLSARPEDAGTYVCTMRNSEGASEMRVEVVVEGGSRLPVVPRAVAPDPLLIVAEGQTTTLRVVNGSLVLPNVGRQDSGEYICNATNHLGTSEVIVTLDVEVKGEGGAGPSGHMEDTAAGARINQDTIYQPTLSLQGCGSAPRPYFLMVGHAPVRASSEAGRGGRRVHTKVLTENVMLLHLFLEPANLFLELARLFLEPARLFLQPA